ncbi:hypothetical protein [Glycomyces salinus]|uniref:hypothetical protein n=1 Tax=Glycomyces salinus TaxID=980294 RepID=UPI0018ED414B|nr:hypothetical protein [Glycomyces salinus]
MRRQRFDHRNFGIRPGHNFRDSVLLPGWDQRSVWGYDEACGSFFLQLWSNKNISDKPDAWLSGVDLLYPWPGCIALELAELTGSDSATAVNALAIGNPKPWLRPNRQIERAAADNQHGLEADYPWGRYCALLWLLGRAELAPGLLRAWPGIRPTAQQVDAETHFTTGRVYRRNRQAWFAGAEEALVWASDPDTRP